MHVYCYECVISFESYVMHVWYKCKVMQLVRQNKKMCF